VKTWKVKEMIDYIEGDGWYFLRQKGSHRQYRHLKKQGTVTISGRFSDDLLPNTSKSILKQAGLL
jgi:predicted RNA binding protein YcfA (HicA-like mRNA interferase family)